MGPDLLGEIKVTESSGTVSFELPRRGVPPGLQSKLPQFWIGFPLLAGGGYVIYLGVAQMLSFLFGIGVMIAVVGLLMIGSGLALQRTRSSVHLTATELKLQEWIGPIPRELVRPRHRLRRLVTHYAITPGVTELPSRGVLEVICDGAQPLWFATDYSHDLLVALGAELARRCNVPHEIAPLDDKPAVRVQPFFLGPVRDADTLDRDDQPAGSRITVEHRAESTVITVPPPGLWQGVNRLLIGLFVPAGMFLFITGLIVLKAGPGIGLVPWAIFLVALVAVCGLTALLVHNRRRWTVLVVNPEQLGVLFTGGLLGERERLYPRIRIVAVRTGPSRVSERGRDMRELYLYFADRKEVGLCGGRDNAELAWLATQLRQTLAVPAVRREVVSE